MATFGPTEPLPEVVSTGANYINGGRYICPEEGDVTKISIYCQGYTAPVNLIAKIYSDVDGGPDTLLAESLPVTIPTTWGWVDFPISLHVTANTPYWLAAFSEKTWGFTNRLNQPKRGFYQTDAWQTYPNNPGRITYPVFVDKERGMYATYTPQVEGLPPPRITGPFGLWTFPMLNLLAEFLNRLRGRKT